MASLKDLAARLNRKANELDDYKRKAMAVYAIAIVRELLQSTPVDTTEALSNWQVTGGAVSGPIPPHVPGKAGATRAASLGIAFQAAEQAVAANRHSDVLVIFNAAGHIRKLNEGSSAQAPAGFIERAILVGKLAARSELKSKSNG